MSLLYMERFEGIIGIQHLIVVLFEKAGSSYTCLGSYEPSIPPGTDRTTDAMIQQAKVDIHGLGQYELLGAYEVCGTSSSSMSAWLRGPQFLGKHKNLEGKTMEQIQAEIPLDDDYLRRNTNRSALQRYLQTP